MLCGM